MSRPPLTIGAARFCAVVWLLGASAQAAYLAEGLGWAWAHAAWGVISFGVFLYYLGRVR